MAIMKKGLFKAAAVFLFLAAVMPLGAQTTITGAYGDYTPYSVFGIGNLSKQGNTHNRGRGGVGIATRNRRYINYLNPASVTARDSLSFMADFSLAGSNRLFTQGDLNNVHNTVNVYDFMISFPIYRKSAMMLGITPMSDVGYQMKSSFTDPVLISKSGMFNYNASGGGSIYQAFIAGGVTLWDRVSIGAQGIYYFGNLRRNNTLEPSKTDQKKIDIEYDMTVRGITGKFGLQYDLPLNDRTTLTFGATYRLGTKMRGYVDHRQFASISSAVDTIQFRTDTLAKMSANPRFADELGVGIAIRSGERWSAEINYIRSGWGGTNIDKVPGMANESEARFSLTSSESFRAGFEIVPNRNDIRYYLRKCTYMAGLYYDKEYYKIAGQQVTSMGLTFGMTFPILRFYNGITFGVDVGQRGKNDGNMIRERYVNFTVGFNISDIWFQKPRYN